MSDWSENSGFIRFEDEMPPLNEEIEIEHPIRGIIKVTLSIHNSEFFKVNEKGIPYLMEIPGYFRRWRHTTKNIPDLTKLKSGDLIICKMIYPEDEDTFSAGFFKNIEHKWLRITMTLPQHEKLLEGFYMKNIKSIIRINLETRKFEEI